MVAGRVTKTNVLLRLWSDESGASTIELALLTTFFLVPLLLGLTELGWRAWTKAQIDNAASAGIEYALSSLNQVTVTNCAISSAAKTNINNAAGSATKLLTAVTATSSAFCGCPTSSGVTVQAAGSTCSDGMAAGDYLTVNATMTYSPLFRGCMWKDAPLNFCSVITLFSTKTARLD